MARLSAGAGYQYLLRHTACGDVQRDPTTPLTQYYTASGYPPGSWWGSGLSGLGVPGGATVSEEGMSRLYGQGCHPTTGEPLGRAYPVYRSQAQRIADAVAALPEQMTDPARADAVAAITRVESGRRQRVAVAGFDLTFTAPKSASVLWALADPGVQAAVTDAHRAAVRDALAFLQDRALFTRIGVNSCAQVPTQGMVAALFDHWDTRTGDPNLHTHVVIANKVQGLDGVWRSVDSRALHHAAVAVSELYDNVFADRLTAVLGDELDLAWSWRDRGPRRTLAFELDAVPDVLLGEFSTRSAAIAAAMTDAVAAFQAKHGRSPSRVETTRLRQRLTTATRPAKTLQPLPELMRWWRDRARALCTRAPHRALAFTWESDRSVSAGTAVVRRPVRHEPVGEHDPRPGVERRRPAHRTLRTRLHLPTRCTAPDGIPAAVLETFADASIAAVMQRRSTWTRWNLTAEAARVTRGVRCRTPEERIVLHDQVVAVALTRCVALNDGDRWTVPEGWRRPDGISVFDRPDEDRFTHRIVLDAETRLIAATAALDAPTVDPRTAQAAAAAVQPSRHAGGAPVRLAADQVDAVTGIATSARRIDVLVGPAGTGKTTTLRALRSAWEAEHGPGSVIGLAPSASAAHELGDALGVPCENTAKWLHETTGPGGAQRTAARDELEGRRAASVTTDDHRGVRRADAALHRLDAQDQRWTLRPGTLVIVDEASLAGTLALDQLADQATRAGAKLLLVGDHHQLGAVDAGGAFGLLATTGSAHHLRSLWRFSRRWEAHATRALRDGHPGVIATYDRHGRIHEAGSAQILEDAYTAWQTHVNSGATALLIAADTATVTALNHRAHTDRVTDGHVDDTRTVRLGDGLDAGPGDVVVARRNDRRQLLPGGGHLRNGTRATISATHDDGSVDVTIDGSAAQSRAVLTLSAVYVRNDLELGYATTVHRAQGATVDHAHLLVTPAMTREALYVGLTRGRHSNHAYVSTEPLDGDCDHLPDNAATPGDARDQLVRILGSIGRERSATELLRASTRDRSAAEVDAVRATLGNAPAPYDVGPLSRPPSQKANRRQAPAEGIGR